MDTRSLLLLIAAIGSEIIATSALKASEGFSRPLPTVLVIVGYGVALYLLSLAIKTIDIGAAYAIWSGVGTVGIAIVGALVFRQQLTPGAIVGMALIVVGVVVLNLFGEAHV